MTQRRRGGPITKLLSVFFLSAEYFAMRANPMKRVFIAFAALVAFLGYAILKRMRYTIGEKYAAAEFRPTGFDYLRIILAVSILLWHAILVCHAVSSARGVVETQWKVPLLFLVPSFFSLSGFLIAGSLERSTIPAFIGLRILRIVPALAVDTLLTLLIVGPLFTTLPLREYFSNKVTWKYLTNILGHINCLPVFHNNPISQIIRSAWNDFVGVRLLFHHCRSSARRNSEVEDLFLCRRDRRAVIYSSYIGKCIS